MKNKQNSSLKNTVIVLPCDFSACGYIRIIDRIRVLSTHYAEQNFLPIISPRPIFDSDILETTRAILIQRCYTTQMLKIVAKYYELQPIFKYKIIYDIDDMLFNFDKWQCPTYLPVHELYGDGKAGNVATEIIHMCDAVNVSTTSLGNCIKDLSYKGEINLIKNVIPIHMYGSSRKGVLLKDLQKPTILYAGSKSHYIQGNSGDLTPNWLGFLKKNVIADKITFLWMWSCPDFLEDVKDKVKFIPSSGYLDFPRRLHEIRADFQIGPLVENWFNACKSDIKALQSYATDSVFIGTKFKSIPGPYDDCKNTVRVNATIDEIDEKFWSLTKVNEYNETINWQRLYLVENDRYMECVNAQTEFMKSLCFRK